MCVSFISCDLPSAWHRVQVLLMCSVSEWLSEGLDASVPGQGLPHSRRDPVQVHVPPAPTQIPRVPASLPDAHVTCLGLSIRLSNWLIQTEPPLSATLLLPSLLSPFPFCTLLG